MGAHFVDETPAIGISGRWKRLGKVFFAILHEVEDYPRRRSIASPSGNRWPELSLPERLH